MEPPFFLLEDDLYTENRWYLDGLADNRGRELDAREFRYGACLDLGPPLKARLWNKDEFIEAEAPLRVLLDHKRPGMPLDFTYTNSDMPVATARVAEILTSTAGADVQGIPVCVESQDEWYRIINVATCIDCIDREKSVIQWYEEGNTVRPDLAGQPEMVLRLAIDPHRVGTHNVFRVKGWRIAIVVSDMVKRAFEEHNVSGVRFLQVSA